MKNKCLVLIISGGLTLLTGCGGGGGGGSSSSPDITELSLNPASSLSLVEGSESSLDMGLNYTGNKSLTYLVTSDLSNDAFDYSVTDGVMTFSNISLNTGTDSVVLHVSVSDGDVQDDAQIVANLDNISASGVIVTANMYQSQTDVILAMAELATIDHYYSKTNEFAEIVSPNLKLITQSSTMLGVKEKIEAAQHSVANYHNGAISESELVSITDGITTSLNHLANERLADINLEAGANSSLIQLPTVKFTAHGGSFSYFKGNLEYGNYDGDDWTFSATYGFLTTMLDPLDSQCEI